MAAGLLQHNCCSTGTATPTMLTTSYIRNSVSVLFEKGCGYRFMAFFLPDMTATDMYRYVQLYYPDAASIRLSVDDAQLESTDGRKLKELFRGSRPLFPIPEKVCYKVVVSLDEA